MGRAFRGQLHILSKNSPKYHRPPAPPPPPPLPWQKIARTPMVISTIHFPPGFFRCGQNCATCPYITDGLTSYTFYATGETRSITSHITCNTKNVIYMVQCNRCNLQPIGETKQAGMTSRNIVTKTTHVVLNQLFCVTPLKIDQNQNQNRSIVKVRNLAN